MDEQEAEDRRTNCMLKKSLNVFFFFEGRERCRASDLRTKY